MSQPKPVKVALFPNRELAILWDDSREDYISAHTLRCLCPCAECVDEITGQRTLDPQTVAQHLRIERWEPVGNYALRFFFSDGHSVGMYTFESLRAIGERGA